MKISFVVEAKELNGAKELVSTLNGEVIATQLQQFGFSDNSNIIVHCRIPKRNLKKAIGKVR